MTDQLILTKQEAKKATESDWDEILKLLDETKLSFWLSGTENYKNFYVIKDKNNILIACFAIYCEGNIGIIKSFAVSKRIQGKGIGKHLANKIIPEIGKDLNLTILYLLAGNKDPFVSIHFWRKTVYKSIKEDEVKEKYAAEYLANVKKNCGDYYDKNAIFYLPLAKYN